MTEGLNFSSLPSDSAVGKAVYALARMTNFFIFYIKHLQLDTWNCWLLHNDIRHSWWDGMPSNNIFETEHHLTGCSWSSSMPPDIPSRVTFWGPSLSPLRDLLHNPSLKSLIPINRIMAGHLSLKTLLSIAIGPQGIYKGPRVINC